MLQFDNPEETAVAVRNALFEGTDALGFQNEALKPEFRNDEGYKRIFGFMQDKPVYVTNYRGRYNEKKSDEELMEELVSLRKYGATLFDVMGDAYMPTKGELTCDKEAVAKQMALIDRIHSFGGEVLMSSHILEFTPADRVVEVALEHQKRGADIVKIVTAANSEDEEFENLNITRTLKKELSVPFLFLSGGTHYKMHRMIGPMFGCCMYLCVDRHHPLSTKMQPMLRAAKAVMDNFDYKPDKSFDF